jgi:hypothetical protein
LYHLTSFDNVEKSASGCSLCSSLFISLSLSFKIVVQHLYCHDIRRPVLCNLLLFALNLPYRKVYVSIYRPKGPCSPSIHVQPRASVSATRCYHCKSLQCRQYSWFLIAGSLLGVYGVPVIAKVCFGNCSRGKGYCQTVRPPTGPFRSYFLCCCLLSHASAWLFGHVISEQNLLIYTRFQLLNSKNNVLFYYTE